MVCSTQKFSTKFDRPIFLSFFLPLFHSCRSVKVVDDMIIEADANATDVEIEKLVSQKVCQSFFHLILKNVEIFFV